MSASKRYFDPLQAESDHKDLVISQLKTELYELKANQKDYNYLNNQLNSLQHKYTLLQEEKLRTERDRRQKMELDQRSVLNYKDEFDQLQIDIRGQNIDLQEASADYRALREMADLRIQEIDQLKTELSEIQDQNDRNEFECKDIEKNVKKIQDDKKQIIKELDLASADADSLIHSNRTQEKKLQNLRIDNQNIDQNLLKQEQFNDKLSVLLKEKDRILNDQDLLLRENEKILQKQQHQLEEARSANERALADAKAYADKYQAQLQTSREISRNLTNTETTLRSKELHIDDLRNNFQVLKNKNDNFYMQNKDSKEQIESLLKTIEELNQTNKELIQQIDLFTEQDEKVRALLDRREESTELVNKIDEQLKESLSNIIHLTNKQ